jgi:3-oxoacyl-[acyl-carrier protein] reductase
VKLTGQVAMIWGAGGAIGATIATAFAEAGAVVHLCGRNESALEPLAATLRSSKAVVHTSVVDALDETAVDGCVAGAIDQSGHLDISVNVIGIDDVQGTPLIDMSLEDFERPISNATRSHFLTSRAVARHMVDRRSGTIITFGGGAVHGDALAYNLGAFRIALRAVDAFRLQLAHELGPSNVRVVTLQSNGVLESFPDEVVGRDQIEHAIVDETMLKRSASLNDVAEAALFAATCSALTGSVIDISCGATSR